MIYVNKQQLHGTYMYYFNIFCTSFKYLLWQLCVEIN